MKDISPRTPTSGASEKVPKTVARCAVVSYTNARKNTNHRSFRIHACVRNPFRPHAPASPVQVSTCQAWPRLLRGASATCCLGCFRSSPAMGNARLGMGRQGTLRAAVGAPCTPRCKGGAPGRPRARTRLKQAGPRLNTFKIRRTSLLWRTQTNSKALNLTGRCRTKPPV